MSKRKRPYADWYAVIDIATGNLLFLGRSLSMAAAEWVPGSFWGRGMSAQDAISHAIERQKTFLSFGTWTALEAMQ